jgi:hypothetical protein
MKILVRYCSRNKRIFQVNSLRSHFKKLVKDEKTKSKSTKMRKNEDGSKKNQRKWKQNRDKLIKPNTA